jgi:hypothetical protein
MACGSSTPSASDLLELELDIRTRSLWTYLTTNAELTLEFVGSLMRAAYGQGYLDSLTEPVPGLMLRELGYTLPRKP